MTEEEEVDLHEGMPISNEEGEDLGTLSALLVEDEEEDAEFFLVKLGNEERLLPFDAVLGVGDGQLIVDATLDGLARYPLVKAGTEPSDDDIEKAYDVYEETAQYTDE